MNKLVNIVKNGNYNNICILGFGREGKSTLAFLKEHHPCRITIADENEVTLDDADNQNITLKTGAHYLDDLNQFDLIIKSPGISLPLEIENPIKEKLTSQTALFLQAYHKQIIGITGTKGKSTTSSLIYHILKENGIDAVLVGNIGIPAWSMVSAINKKSIIVCELSAQQLYDVKHSPYIALFLNLFSDHIDYFGNMERYSRAKCNIYRFQERDDFFIFSPSREIYKCLRKNDFVTSEIIRVTKNDSYHFKFQDGQVWEKWKKKLILDFKKTPLKGEHNFINMIFALEAVKMATSLSFEDMIPAVYSFQTLSNRLEYVGTFDEKHFYNDSIATVPEAAIAALQAIENVQTIILGGYDRGVDLTNLMTAVAKSPVSNVIFTGPSGKRMMETLNVLFPEHEKTIFYFENYNGLVEKAAAITPPNSACVLAPASPSFDSFKNFEERGEYFKNAVLALAKRDASSSKEIF
jgi:UDP-N-acetylmuramoylalanine--D-glutamate ligase